MSQSSSLPSSAALMADSNARPASTIGGFTKFAIRTTNAVGSVFWTLGDLVCKVFSNIGNCSIPALTAGTGSWIFGMGFIPGCYLGLLTHLCSRVFFQPYSEWIWDNMEGKDLYGNDIKSSPEDPKISQQNAAALYIPGTILGYAVPVGLALVSMPYFHTLVSPFLFKWLSFTPEMFTSYPFWALILHLAPVIAQIFLVWMDPKSAFNKQLQDPKSVVKKNARYH